MSRKTAGPLVPKLRFPEFADAPGWELKALGKVLKPIVRERKKPAIAYTGLGLRSHGRGTFLKEEQQPDKIAMDCLYEVAENDLIVNITFAWEGAISIAGPQDAGALVSHRFPTYELEKVEPGFLKHPILSKRFIYDLGVISPGGAGRNRVMNKSDFLKLRLPIPTLREQQTIAECFGSLDDLIKAECRKLDALRQHKKGLMQQLFPQPGETVPRLRFPEFRDTGEWLTPNLCNLYNFQRTNNLSRDKLNYGSGTVRNIHYGDIHSKFRTLFCLDEENVPFINNNAIGDGIEDEAFCQVGDIVIADASEDLRDVGKAIEIVSLAGERVVAGTHTILARRQKDFPAIGFGGYLFQSAIVRAGIEKEAQGAKVFGISPNRISNITVPLPQTKAEQQQIASCLSVLDSWIGAQMGKIESLGTHKRGLLQQLFPALEGKQQ